MAAFDVDVAAAEEDVDGLADAIEQVVGRGVYGADAMELGADEEGRFAVQGFGVVTLALLLRAGDGRAGLAEAEGRGGSVLGHQKGPRVPKYSRGTADALPKVKPNPKSS